jgi:POT family proton-dependent oligopeptide transporter
MIPLFDFVIYPFFEARRFSLHPISRMVSGMVLSSMAFLVSGLLQQAIDGQGASNLPLSILWQAPQYVMMTAGEITSIEFAYFQAPDSMKAIMQAASLFTVFAAGSAGKAPCSSFMSPPIISHAGNMASVDIL